MSYYTLTPLDTLFFRDGRPFNLGETGQMEVESSFPPSPTSVVGALRAAFARGQGWTGNPWDAWNERLTTHLGDGEDLGNLSFRGPYLFRNGALLYPASLLLLGKQIEFVENGEKKKKWRLTRLKPGAALSSDIKDVHFPEAIAIFDEQDKEKKLEGLKELNAWLTEEGMKRVLAGGTPEPEEVVSRDQLWKTEDRVGILRKGRNVEETDGLYNIQHTRLVRDIALGIELDGLSEHTWQPQNPATLGGESRCVWLEKTDPWKLLDAPMLSPNESDEIRYTVTLLTPADIRDDSWRRAGASLGSLPGKVVSACVGKPVLVGGWDSRPDERRPRPLKPLLPAGSTWFMKVEKDTANATDIQKLHGTPIGERQPWGYGQILIGTWEE